MRNIIEFEARVRQIAMEKKAKTRKRISIITSFCTIAIACLVLVVVNRTTSVKKASSPPVDNVVIKNENQKEKIDIEIATMAADVISVVYDDVIFKISDDNYEKVVEYFKYHTPLRLKGDRYIVIKGIYYMVSEDDFSFLEPLRSKKND